MSSFHTLSPHLLMCVCGSVVEWASFMKAQGVKRVVGLLSASELQTYEAGPPSEVLALQGLQAINIAVEEGDPGA